MTLWGEDVNSRLGSYHSNCCDLCANRGPCISCGRGPDGKFFRKYVEPKVDGKKNSVVEKSDCSETSCKDPGRSDF